MIRIAISQAAFEAIASTMPLGSVGYESEANADQLLAITDHPRGFLSGRGSVA